MRSMEQWEACSDDDLDHYLSLLLTHVFPNGFSRSPVSKCSVMPFYGCFLSEFIFYVQKQLLL